MNLETLKSKYRDKIIQLATEHKLGEVRVFGSTVRGEEREDSDIDLLVHLQKGCSLLDVSAFEVEVSKLLGKKIDVVDDVAIRPILAPYIVGSLAIMKKIDTDIIRLQDILSAISDIESYKISDLRNKMTLHAVLYNIAIIGEAANKLSATLRENNPQIPWDAIINMRHRIVHDYGNINLQSVQDVVDNDLSKLRADITKITKK